MQFGEMVQKVVTRTKRPDKADEIEDAINNAISFFSTAASFSHDLIEGTVAINPTQHAQSISISDNFPRFRRIKYLQRTGQRGFLSKIDPHNAFDIRGCERLDAWYRAGDNLVFKLKTLSPTLEYGYFTYPQTMLAPSDEHWMMEQVPLMIFNMACAEIFDSIGEPNDAKVHNGRAMGMFEIARNDFMDSGTARAA